MLHAALSQAEILAAITDLLSGSGPMQRIDTHASIVFLAGKRALKIKRAVKFPFLDYSTLERRKAACEEEIGVNQLLAPQIYKGVIAITKENDGSLRIGGSGTPIEWAVDMARFDENATLDKLADRGPIDDKLADNLARAIVSAHRNAPKANVGPWLTALRSFIAQNDAAFRSNLNLFPLHDIEALTALSLNSLKNSHTLLLQRGAAGFVKRLHGDLHLGNIVVLDGHPVLFDAIEFDPIVATGDVLYDFAFLIMDLVERDQRPMATIVLNRYLQQTDDMSNLDALAAMPLFLSMRAAIRAKVTAARCESVDAAAQASLRSAAGTYFRLALAFLKPTPPILLAIGGLSGTGKSVLAIKMAPALGPAPGAIVLRSDLERKQLFGVGEFTSLPAEAYAQQVTKSVYFALARKAGRVIQAGHSVIVDAVYADAGERAGIARIAEERQAAFCGLFLSADIETRLSRVANRSDDASDADRTIVLQQSRYDLGTLDWIAIDASGTPEETLVAAQKRLAADLGRAEICSSPHHVHPNSSPVGPAP